MTVPFNSEMVVETSPVPAPEIITVTVTGMQAPSNMWIGPTNELTPGSPGIWIQTGLAPAGTGFTIWLYAMTDEGLQSMILREGVMNDGTA